MLAGVRDGVRLSDSRGSGCLPMKTRFCGSIYTALDVPCMPPQHGRMPTTGPGSRIAPHACATGSLSVIVYVLADAPLQRRLLIRSPRKKNLLSSATCVTGRLRVVQHDRFIYHCFRDVRFRGEAAIRRSHGLSSSPPTSANIVWTQHLCGTGWRRVRIRPTQS
ncbi:hypothetical protein BV25DRAFT_1437377 [Artomyces pyxidatus]|uniref:Uncharacterized protein n=1 Tax=Artomyces pyxidatus TaxID=48021 RepID=A0ACB8SNP2_9AGAM|nr:hypothetical protein BV25DRAFT_1437377 [Artomyces pyxidatus]